MMSKRSHTVPHPHTDVASPSPMLSDLGTWGENPRSVATLEALLRDEHYPVSNLEAASTMSVFADLLSTSSIPACSQSPALLLACTSMVVTLGRVLHAVPPTSSRVGTSRVLAGQPIGLPSADAFTALDQSLRRVGGMHTALFQALKGLPDHADPQSQTQPAEPGSQQQQHPFALQPSWCADVD